MIKGLAKAVAFGAALCGGQAMADDLPRPALVPRHEAVEDPSLGVGLNGVADWTTQQPFLDVMKTARPWLGHTADQWGAWDNARLADGGYLSPEGWPLSLPPGVDRLETLVLTDLPEEARDLAGTYLLRWQGDADVDVSGRADLIDRGERSLRFAFQPGSGLVGVAVTRVNPDDPIRDMTLVRDDRADLFDAGAIFNPDFLARVRDFRALRFMDWMVTNGSTQVVWNGRPKVADASWAQRGIPLEIMVQLANEVGADPWFNIPHQADDAYVAAFAEHVRANLDPRLKAYAEWSNEVWNFIFPQTHWAADAARARWGDSAGEDAWMQFAGLRASEVADIWARTFGDEAESRLVRVVGVHTGWMGLETGLLEAPLAVAEGRPPPAESFDAYAVTGYFGGSAGSEEMSAQLQGWIREGRAEAEVTALAQAGIDELVETLWPYHAEVARRWGLRLVAYEGGTHITGQGSVVENDRITSFFTSFSYSPEMADLYEDLLAGWNKSGGTLFMAFVDVAAPSQWGSWGALRYLSDENPRWDRLMLFNAVPPTWESRDTAAFAQGVQIIGTDADEVLTGTPEEDDLVGKGGADTLNGLGGSDRIDGGEGWDQAQLPGAADDWTREDLGTAILFRRGREQVRLTDVEEVLFLGTGEVLVLDRGE